MSLVELGVGSGQYQAHAFCIARNVSFLLLFTHLFFFLITVFVDILCLCVLLICFHTVEFGGERFES